MKKADAEETFLNIGLFKNQLFAQSTPQLNLSAGVLRRDAQGSVSVDSPARHAGWPTCRFRFEPKPYAVRGRRHEESECCSHRAPSSSRDRPQDRNAPC